MSDGKQDDLNIRANEEIEKAYQTVAFELVNLGIRDPDLIKAMQELGKKIRAAKCPKQ